MISIGLISALLAVLSWSVYNIAGKKSAVRLGKFYTALIMSVASFVPIIFALLIMGTELPSVQAIVLSLLAGLSAFAGMMLYFKALETEQLTNAVAIGEISPAILTIFGVFVLHEPVTFMESMSIILIFAGSFLVMSTVGFKINKKLIPAFLAAVAWAIYWLLITGAVVGSNTFVFQMMAARITQIIPLLLIFYFGIGMVKPKFKSLKIGKDKLAFLIGITAAAGIFDSTGDLFFSFALKSNIVALGGAVSALSPILVSVLSYFVFKDRLSKVQAVGLAIIVIGAFALVVT